MTPPACHHETLVFTRAVTCGADRLWLAWTDPAARAVWSAPNDRVTVDYLETGTYPGGREVSVCRSAGSPEIRCEVGWIAVEPPFLSLNTEILHRDGKLLSAAMVTAGCASTDTGAALTVTVQLASFAADMADDYRTGFDGGLQNLAARAETAAPEVMEISRHYDAPPERLWQAWTDPEALPRWWGPAGFTCRTREIDLREGGVWRFDMIGPDGTVYRNRHRYTKHLPNRRIDYLLDDDGAGEMPAKTVRIRFAPEGSGTRLSLHMTFASAEEMATARGYGAVELGYQTLAKLAAEVGA